MWRNHIGNEGAEALIDAHNHNVCMTQMNLFDNNITLEFESSIRYIHFTRNEILISAAVRRASLYLITARRTIADAGNLSIFPREIIKMIAMQVWATRKDPIWIGAIAESARTGEYVDAQEWIKIE